MHGTNVPRPEHSETLQKSKTLVQIKSLILLFCLALLLPTQTTFARTFSTPIQGMCRKIESDLTRNVLAERDPLPESWDDLPLVSRLKESPNSVAESYLRSINSLALEPGCPELETERPAGMKGRRLFAISCVANLDGAEGTEIKGRYAILIERGGTAALVVWLQERHVAMLLGDDYESILATLPMAFDETTLSHAQRPPERNSSDTRSPAEIVNGNRAENAQTKDDTEMGKHEPEYKTYSWKIMLVGILVVSASVALIIILRGRKETGGLR